MPLSASVENEGQSLVGRANLMAICHPSLGCTGAEAAAYLLLLCPHFQCEIWTMELDSLPRGQIPQLLLHHTQPLRPLQQQAAAPRFALRQQASAGRVAQRQQASDRRSA